MLSNLQLIHPISECGQTVPLGAEKRLNMIGVAAKHGWQRSANPDLPVGCGGTASGTRARKDMSRQITDHVPGRGAAAIVVRNKVAVVDAGRQSRPAKSATRTSEVGDARDGRTGLDIGTRATACSVMRRQTGPGIPGADWRVGTGERWRALQFLRCIRSEPTHPVPTARCGSQ